MKQNSHRRPSLSVTPCITIKVAIDPSSFRSILASNMIKPTYMKAINTAQDLFVSELEIHATSATSYYIMTSPIPIIQKLGNRIVHLPNPSSLTYVQDLSHVVERFVNRYYMHVIRMLQYCYLCSPRWLILISNDD